MGNILAGAKSMMSAKGIGQIAVVVVALTILVWLGYGPDRLSQSLPARS